MWIASPAVNHRSVAASSLYNAEVNHSYTEKLHLNVRNQLMANVGWWHTYPGKFLWPSSCSANEPLNPKLMPAEVPGLGEVTMTQRNTKPPNIAFIFACSPSHLLLSPFLRSYLHFNGHFVGKPGLASSASFLPSFVLSTKLHFQ